MEIFEAVLVSLLIGVVGQVLSAVIGAITWLFTTTLSVEVSTQISAVDRMIVDTGVCSGRVLGQSMTPMSGTHFFFYKRPIVAVKSITTTERGGSRAEYTLYVICGGVKDIRDKILGNPDNIPVSYVYAPMPWKISSVTARLALPGAPYAWQRKVVNKIIAAYSARGGATALLCGRPGAGKSTIGEFVAAEMIKRLGSAPQVIKGVDLTARGMLLEDAFNAPTQTAPIILLLDEFDTAIDFAEKPKEGKGDAKSLADSPASLLSLLDRINRIDHLIVIASTNKRVGEMTSGVYARYTRKGRLDMHITA